MTDSNTKTKDVYPWAGTRREWPVTFTFFSAADVRVWRVDAKGKAELKTAGFSVDTAAKTVYYPLEGSDESIPCAGEYVVLQRVTPLTQEVDVKRQSVVDNQTWEDAHDLAVLREQELAEELSRALRFPIQYQGVETDAAAYLARITELKETAVSAAREAAEKASSSAEFSQNAARTAQEAVREAEKAVADLSDYTGQALAAKEAAQISSSSAQGDAVQCAAARSACEEWAVSCRADGASARDAARAARDSQTAAEDSALEAQAAKQAAQESRASSAESALQARQAAENAEQSAAAAADKARTDLSNVSQITQSRVDAIMPSAMDYVAESWRDGKNWWRKWKSGRLEQGGVLGPISQGTFTLFKPYQDADYVILVSGKGQPGNAGDSGGALWAERTGVNTFTIQFRSRNFGNIGSFYFDFYTCGQGA